MNFENPEATAREGIAAFKSFVKELGMPTAIGEIGGKPEDAPKLANDMFFEAPNHGSYVKLTPEIAEEIYRMAM
jgi:alcohol dehydrogenase class IV